MKVANEVTYQGIEMMLEGLLLHSYLSSAHMLGPQYLRSLPPHRLGLTISIPFSVLRL
jgi:hypothetical protein